MTTKEKAKVGRPMGKLHQDDVRAKIQAGQLIKILMDHADGTEEKELSASRLQAIKILLNKSLPDLQSVQLTGDADNPVQMDLGVTVFGELLNHMKLERQTER